MYQFNYERPKTLADAEALLGKADDPKILAGGQTLIPTLKQRLAMPSDVIDIGGIGELDFIRAEGDAVMIGAATRHATVAQSADVKKHNPALAALAGGIGDPAVRHMGTLGGSIANNDPAADYPAACLGLDAKIHTTRRLIEADEFFKGMFETALQDGEIVKEVTFPRESRLHEVPQSGVALRNGRRLRFQGAVGRSRRGHRRWPERRLPHRRNGRGAREELVAGCCRKHQGAGHGPQ
jgi:carbon-monoxide dehydrogenase medium subunit